MEKKKAWSVGLKVIAIQRTGEGAGAVRIKETREAVSIVI
jgi:hypothetical protein